LFPFGAGGETGGRVFVRERQELAIPGLYLDFGVGVGERFVFVGSNPFARFFVPHDFSIGRTPPSKVGWIFFVLHQGVVGGGGGAV